MKLFSVAIGEQYEREAERLSKCVPVEVFTKDNSNYKRVNDDPLIDGLWHKTNFANYIDDDVKGPVIFMDADIVCFDKDPFKDFKVKKGTEVAYVPYDGKFYLPDKIRQDAFDYHGHKINSGFLYFKDLKTAKNICTAWSDELTKRPQDWIKNEYDEWALMIALMKMPDLKIELLDKKWNVWEFDTKEEMLNFGGIFFQTHKDIVLD